MMWQTDYKGFTVKGYDGFRPCTIHGYGHPLASRVYNSYRSAQLAITKYIKASQGGYDGE